MNTPTLRDYQLKLVGQAYNALRQADRILVQLPTGGGKTPIAAKIISDTVDRNLNVLFIAHREELILQAREHLRLWGIEPGLIKSGYPVSPLFPVQVASIQTLLRRELPPADLVIIDEAHHATSRGYLDVICQYPRSKLIGFTATPCRSDGTGLNLVFDHLICGPTVKWLIKNGWLCQYLLLAEGKTIDTSKIKVVAGDYSIAQLAKAANKKHLIGDLVQAYEKHCQGKKAVVFAVNVEHSKKIVDRYNSHNIKAAHLDGTTPDAERSATLEQFRKGKIKVLSNCELFTEGFDMPAIEAVQLARPTQSAALALQMIGRGLRTAPRKKLAYILDHAGVIRDHGLPDAPRSWSLEGGLPKVSSNTKKCSRCEATIAAHLKQCPHCGNKFGGRERLITAIDAELEEVREVWQPIDRDLMIDWTQPEEVEFPIDHRGQYLLFC